MLAMGIASARVHRHYILQKLVLSYETLVILTVISGAIAIGLFVHNTTAQIRKELPTEVLEQQQDISYMVQDLSDLVRAAEIANLTPSSDHTSRLLVKLDQTLAKLQAVRQTYNFDNLIGASAMHAIVNPALLDIRRWLTAGLPGIPSHSPIIFDLVQQRVNETYQQIQDLFVQANASATALITLEKNRLTRFRNSMFLYLSIFALYATGVVILFVSQRNIKARLALEQKRLTDSIESINEGFALFDKNDQLVICNQNFREFFPPVAKLITTGANLGKFRSLANKFSRPPPRRPRVAGVSPPDSIPNRGQPAKPLS